MCLYRHSWHRCLLHKCKSSHLRLSLITIDSCNTGHYVQFREGSLHKLAGDDESLESCSPIGSWVDRQVCDISVGQYEFCLQYVLRTKEAHTFLGLATCMHQIWLLNSKCTVTWNILGGFHMSTSSHVQETHTWTSVDLVHYKCLSHPFFFSTHQHALVPDAVA